MNKIDEAIGSIQAPKHCNSEEASIQMASNALLKHMDIILAALRVAKWKTEIAEADSRMSDSVGDSGAALGQKERQNNLNWAMAHLQELL